MRSGRLRFVAGVVLGVALGSGAGCTTTAKKDIAKTALDAMSDSERRDTFEATTRVLEQKPELVDELYATVRRHPAVLDRFFADASKDLVERPRAEMMAKHLVESPDALEEAMIASVDFVAHDAAARAALDRAIARRADTMIDIVTDSPETVSKMLGAGLHVLARKPAAERAALVAVRAHRHEMLAFLKSDPELVEDVARELLEEEVKDKPALEKALRAAKVLPER